jgi:hypothetical protein
MSESRTEEGPEPLRRVVISRPGAAIYAEVILLDDEMRRSLSANIPGGYLPPPPGSKLKR